MLPRIEILASKRARSVYDETALKSRFSRHSIERKERARSVVTPIFVVFTSDITYNNELPRFTMIYRALFHPQTRKARFVPQELLYRQVDYTRFGCYRYTVIERNYCDGTWRVPSRSRGGRNVLSTREDTRVLALHISHYRLV